MTRGHKERYNNGRSGTIKPLGQWNYEVNARARTMKLVEGDAPKKQWETKNNETSKAIALREQWEVKDKSKSKDNGT
jgi:hypothetical protein